MHKATSMISYTTRITIRKLMQSLPYDHYVRELSDCILYGCLSLLDYGEIECLCLWQIIDIIDTPETVERDLSDLLVPSYQTMLKKLGINGGCIVSYGALAFFAISLAIKNHCEDNKDTESPFFNERNWLSCWMEDPYRQSGHLWVNTIRRLDVREVMVRYRGSILASTPPEGLDYDRKTEFISGVVDSNLRLIRRYEDFERAVEQIDNQEEEPDRSIIQTLNALNNTNNFQRAKVRSKGPWMAPTINRQLGHMVHLLDCPLGDPLNDSVRNFQCPTDNPFNFSEPTVSEEDRWSCFGVTELGDL